MKSSFNTPAVIGVMNLKLFNLLLLLLLPSQLFYDDKDLYLYGRLTNNNSDLLLRAIL